MENANSKICPLSVQDANFTAQRYRFAQRKNKRLISQSENEAFESNESVTHRLAVASAREAAIAAKS